MQNTFIFKIDQLFYAKLAATFEGSFDVETDFELENNCNISSGVKGDFTLMKLDEGINVQLTDVELDITCKCSKCLEKFTETIFIPEMQRVFLFEEVKNSDDEFDVFYVNKRHSEIDATDMIRQEIILHFQLNPLCSNSCKGLCYSCGTNLNKKTCSCEKKESKENKPLHDLKNLISSKN
jgi:uncharacterized protein